MKKVLLCLLFLFFGLSGVEAKEHWKHGGWGHHRYWYRGWCGGGYGRGYWRGGVWISVQPYPYYPGYYGYGYYPGYGY